MCTLFLVLPCQKRIKAVVDHSYKNISHSFLLRFFSFINRKDRNLPYLACIPFFDNFLSSLATLSLRICIKFYFIVRKDRELAAALISRKKLLCFGGALVCSGRLLFSPPFYLESKESSRTSFYSGNLDVGIMMVCKILDRYGAVPHLQSFGKN